MTALVEQSDLAHGHVEELDEVLEREDEKSVQKEYSDHLEHVAELETFRESFRKKVSASRPARASKAAIKNAAGGKYPRAFPAGVISHASAKALAPPRCFVWRALTVGQWCGGCPPLWGGLAKMGEVRRGRGA